MSASKFTHAVMSRVPDIYAETFSGDRRIDLDEARRQHSRLAACVRGIGLDVLELPQDESDAASVFTQDLAVVVNGIALMCRPPSTAGSAVRQAEVDTMRAVLKKELNQSIVDPPWSQTALLSGADVLFTGREFFVGLSQHTNTEGAVAVASTWPEYSCTPIKIDGPYHLTYFVCMAGPDVMCVGTSGAAQVVLKRLEREASHRYQTLTLPEDGPAHCLFANSTLVHRTKEEAPKSEAVFSAKVDCARTAVSLSEFSNARPSRPVSSLFLLLRKSRHVKRL